MLLLLYLLNFGNNLLTIIVKVVIIINPKRLFNWLDLLDWNVIKSLLFQIVIVCVIRLRVWRLLIVNIW